MTHKEILEKAIRKAIDGGWPTVLASTMVDWNVYDDPYAEKKPGVSQKMADKLVRIQSYEEIIYNHDFAKALWDDAIIGVGDDDGVLSVDEYFKLIGSQKEWGSCYDGGPHFEGGLWKFYLQQMVIADDPIAYLGENI